MTQKIIRVLSIVLFTCLSTFIATSASAADYDVSNDIHISKISEKGGIIATISIWSEFTDGGALVFSNSQNSWVGYQYENPKQYSVNDGRSVMEIVSGGDGSFLLKNVRSSLCLTAAYPYFKANLCKLGDPAQMWFMQPVKNTRPNGGVPSQYHLRLASDPDKCLSISGAKNQWPKLDSRCPTWGPRISVRGNITLNRDAGAQIDAEMKHLAATYAIHRCGLKKNFDLCQLANESSSVTEWGPGQCLAIWRNTTSTAGFPGTYKFMQSYTSSFLTSEKTTNGWKIGASLSLSAGPGSGAVTAEYNSSYEKLKQDISTTTTGSEVVTNGPFLQPGEYGWIIGKALRKKFKGKIKFNPGSYDEWEYDSPAELDVVVGTTPFSYDTGTSPTYSNKICDGLSENSGLGSKSSRL
ncbi:MAG: hypothetical protein K2P98_07055 [Neisseriaceae bacterium]|nr:hypothetical protein [Neisseriaceae bacterium]